MSRPKFPTGMIMNVGMIRRIRQDQELYDKDPEDYEKLKGNKRKDSYRKILNN